MLDLLCFTSCYLTIPILEALIKISLFGSIFFYVVMMIINILINNNTKGELMS